ncbi:hypothetical protein TURU_124644 [Turdus rufiventris]|nr:hypothetical protein TURU_124644 [Turdus rufiventris]
MNKSAKDHHPMHYNMAPVKKKKGRAKNIFPPQTCAVASARGGGVTRNWEEELKPYQKAYLQTFSYKASKSLEGRRSRKSRSLSHLKPRGQSPAKRHSRQEDSDHATSSQSEEEFEQTQDSDSDTDSIPAAFTKLTGLPTLHMSKKDSFKSMPLTDWKKVQTALAELPEIAAHIFPVRRLNNNLPAYSPVNPKDVQAIARAIAEKGINSAMVSTLIDGHFGNDDMLPFDIKQTCRMIFDGAGMIVFKQEWEDNLEKMLAKVSGGQHPLRNSSL